MPAETKVAKRLIASLLDAGRDTLTAEIQKQDLDGVLVDRVYSEKRGCVNELMGLKEAEARTDRAIRAAWKALTGKALPRGVDAVGHIYGDLAK